MNLPTAVISLSCGACGNELDSDGDVLVCWDCGLDYSSSDPEGAEGTFRDEDAKPCGRALKHPQSSQRVVYSSRREQDGTTTVLVWRTWTHTRSPCTLPESHTSRHYYPTTSTYEDEDAR